MSTQYQGILNEAVLIFFCAGLAIAICGLAAAIYFLRSSDANEDGAAIRKTLAILFGITLVGAIAGITGGSSREGVVGDIIPAALGVVGSVSVYLFGAKPQNNAFVAFAAAGFALSLGLGYAGGAYGRAPTDAFLRIEALCDRIFSDPDILSSQAALAHALALHEKACSNARALTMDQILTDGDGSQIEAQRDVFLLDAAQLRAGFLN